MDFPDNINNEDDPATCRGRAAHARLAARETADEDFRRIFERLAQLYDGKAEILERAHNGVERQTQLGDAEDVSGPSHVRGETEYALVASAKVED